MSSQSHMPHAATYECVDENAEFVNGGAGLSVAWTKPSVGDCFVISGRLVNTYCELHFRSIQLLPNVLFRNNSLGS